MNFEKLYANIDEVWGCNITLPKVSGPVPDDPVCQIYSKPFQIAEPEEEKYDKSEYEVRRRQKQNKKAMIVKGERLVEAFDGKDEGLVENVSDDEEIDRYIQRVDDNSDKKQYINFLMYVVTGAFLIIVLDLFFRMGQWAGR